MTGAVFREGNTTVVGRLVSADALRLADDLGDVDLRFADNERERDVVLRRIVDCSAPLIVDFVVNADRDRVTRYVGVHLHVARDVHRIRVEADGHIGLIFARIGKGCRVSRRTGELHARDHESAGGICHAFERVVACARARDLCDLRFVVRARVDLRAAVLKRDRIAREHIGRRKHGMPAATAVLVRRRAPGTFQDAGRDRERRGDVRAARHRVVGIGNCRDRDGVVCVRVGLRALIHQRPDRIAFDDVRKACRHGMPRLAVVHVRRRAPDNADGTRRDREGMRPVARCAFKRIVARLIARKPDDRCGVTCAVRIGVGLLAADHEGHIVRYSVLRPDVADARRSDMALSVIGEAER